MIRRIALVATALLLISGCKNRLEKHGELFAGLMKNPDGLFRGVHIGDSSDRVQQEEGTAPSENTEGVLTYELSIGESGTCTIRYGFENDRLYEIIVDASFEEREEGLKLLTGFRDYLNSVYGPYEKERGTLVWNVLIPGPDQGSTFEMVDESEYSDFGQWSLVIYRHPAGAPVSNSFSIP